MTSCTHQRRCVPTRRANTCRLGANISGQPLQSRGRTSAQVAQEKGTTHRCPLDHTRVSRDLGRSGLSIVEAHGGSTLQESWVVPNPQHLLLTLFFETSMHEEKCPL
jgi:hypothetical protein